MSFYAAALESVLRHPAPAGHFEFCYLIFHSPKANCAKFMIMTFEHITITDDTLLVDLEDGRTISVPIGWYPRLAHGTPLERAHFQISGAGYGIHWPDLDEDIGVEGLLLGKKSAESPASFERWLQRRK
jgi:hypothetical protein